VSLESIHVRLRDVYQKNPKIKKPPVKSTEYFRYMKHRITLLNSLYLVLKEAYPEMDKFTMRNER